MDRRAFVTGLGAALAAPGGAGAQPTAKKLAKIGWLAPYPPDPHSPEGQAFWQEMNRAAPLAGKRLGLLKEALPFVTRIGIMWNAMSASNARVVRSVTSMSRTLGIEPHSIEVRKDSHLRDAFRSMVSKRVHAFIVVAENLFWEFRKETVDGALAHRLPGTYPWPEHVRIGGLMSYSHDHVDVWRRAGAYVGRVLAGADVREL